MVNSSRADSFDPQFLYYLRGVVDLGLVVFLSIKQSASLQPLTIL